jgi:RHS repeat-associated protein
MTNQVSLPILCYTSNLYGFYAKPETQQGPTDRHFGMELSYDYGFNTGSQFNGNISGIKWRSMGDGDYRSYGFEYDPSNRLLRADFNQRAGYNDWKKAVSSNLNINFSMYMGDGETPSSGYDANGNILSMSQYGLQQNASPLIDQLNYSYQQSNSSNKLDLVSDGSGFTPKLGDFKDGGNWGSDYSYDANGNQKNDANKSISNIVYNYLNLPEQVSISGKGTIGYTYDAQGEKRSKTVTETGATVTYKGQNYYNVSITTTTYYINSWVYESKSYSDGTLQNAMGYATKLMFSGHEDGRIRPVYTYNTLTAFAGDYFVKDHLGNIRMVLTDEQQVNYYPATTLEGTYSYGAPEANSMVNQEKQYYRIDPGYIVNKPWYNSYLDYPNHNDVPPSNPNPNYPAGASPGQYATSQKVYSLNGSTNRTGLEMVIKVMAGDKVDIFGRSYHTNYSSVSNSNSTPLSILQIMSGLISSPSNAISGKGVSASQLESWNSGLVPSSFIRGQNYESGTTIPKAYINYIFLDDQFRYVDGGASRVGNYGEVKQHWSELSNLAAQKNGYLLVYVSNESNFTVFFDNLQVVHKPGPIVEETHYYPFGLVMNGISSKGLSGVVDNKKKYNGIEQNTDFDLNLYDAFFRNLDPQIGKWWQVDPKIDGQEMWSPYNAMSDNPILHSDPLGDTSILSNQFKTLKQGWDDFNQGKGPAYKSLDFFNRTFNPLTDIYHSFTGKDYITGEKVSRAEGLLGLGLMIVGGKAEMAAAKTIASQAVEGGVNAAKTSTKLPKQIHHFATNKSKTFTPQMSQIADEFGLSLNGAWNKQALPHLGRHPNAYHNFVIDGMQKARAGAGGSQAEFLNLFNQYVKQPVIQNPGLLRKSSW